MIAGRGAALAVLGLAGLLVAIAVSSAWSGATRLSARADETDAVEMAAADFVVAYGTFDFREPEAYARRLVGLTSGELRQAVAGAVIDPAASTQRRVIRAEVQSVAVTALSDGVAAATVEATQSRRWVDAESGRDFEAHVRQRVSCRLVREGGRWLVRELRLLSEEPVLAGSLR